MFLPPEKRHPGHPPWDQPPAKRRLTAREETLLLSLIGFLLFLTVLAPMAGSSMFDALWYVLTR